MVVGVKMGDDKVVVATLIHRMHPPWIVLIRAHKGGSSGIVLIGPRTYSTQHEVMGYYMLE